jgi:hypothetical protein
MGLARLGLKENNKNPSFALAAVFSESAGEPQREQSTDIPEGQKKLALWSVARISQCVR